MKTCNFYHIIFLFVRSDRVIVRVGCCFIVLLLQLDRYTGLSHIVGSKSGRRLRCKFTRELYIPGYKNLVKLDEDHYILLAKGKVDQNGGSPLQSRLAISYSVSSRWHHRQQQCYYYPPEGATCSGHLQFAVKEAF